MAGLLKGLSARGLDDHALPLATEHRAEAAEEAVLQALDSAAPSTALLVCSLPLLVGALRPIERRELAVGRDLALVGWDGGPLVQLARPPIAVVDRNPRSLGAAASALALKRLGHGGARRRPGAGRDPGHRVHSAPALCGDPASPGAGATGKDVNVRWLKWLSCLASRRDGAPW